MKKIIALADHYAIPKEPYFEKRFALLAFELAKVHVPGFKLIFALKDGRKHHSAGRPHKRGLYWLKYLRTQVDTMRGFGADDRAALRQIAICYDPKLKKYSSQPNHYVPKEKNALDRAVDLLANDLAKARRVLQ